MPTIRQIYLIVGRDSIIEFMLGPESRMGNKISKLEMAWRHRAGGGGATARRYLDFIVDGKSLFEMISGDLIGRLGWGTSETDKESVNILLLEKQPDISNGRCLLYVCPECGDI